MTKLRGRLGNYLFDLWVNSLSSANVVPRNIRYRMLRVAGIQTCSRGIFANSFFSSRRIRIGTNTFVNRGCFFDALGDIEIGASCSVAMGVLICTSTHELGHRMQRAGALTAKNVRIGNGCWIGARAVILPGVSVGDGCVIAAGSVVENDCDPNNLYAGIPARKVKSLTDGEMTQLNHEGTT